MPTADLFHSSCKGTCSCSCSFFIFETVTAVVFNLNNFFHYRYKCLCPDTWPVWYGRLIFLCNQIHTFHKKMVIHGFTLRNRRHLSLYVHTQKDSIKNFLLEKKREKGNSVSRATKPQYLTSWNNTVED